MKIIRDVEKSRVEVWELVKFDALMFNQLIC